MEHLKLRPKMPERSLAERALLNDTLVLACTVFSRC